MALVPPALSQRETGISLPNNQRQHRTSHSPEDVLPLRICVLRACRCCELFSDGFDVHFLPSQIELIDYTTSMTTHYDPLRGFWGN